MLDEAHFDILYDSRLDSDSRKKDLKITVIKIIDADGLEFYFRCPFKIANVLHPSVIQTSATTVNKIKALLGL